ncbi:MAG: OmpH family outer membrane protein [Holosporales bacterium]|jgi:Skp family chaperone for outer membrane proteins|nr:OmpH family outer membrane protein [Holosporales bacterium]
MTIRWGILSSFFLFLFLQNSFAAEKETPSQIGVVDIEYINEHAIEMKVTREKVDKLRESFQSKIAELERKVREERQSLDNDKGGFSSEERETRESALERKIAHLQQMAQQYKSRLEHELGISREKFSQRFQSVVAQIAQEQDLKLVITRSAAPYFVQGSDITPLVLKTLDAAAPSVDSSEKEGSAYD